MRVLILAGLMTVVTTPLAFASEDTTECQLDESRRGAAERVEGAAPLTARAAVTVAVVPRELTEAPVQRPIVTERRRSGKRIPDAQLIGPRGAL